MSRERVAVATWAAFLLGVVVMAIVGSVGTIWGWWWLVAAVVAGLIAHWATGRLARWAARDGGG